MMHVAKSLAVLSLVVAVAVAQIPGDRSGESQIDEEGFRSVTNSRESCDAHGNCVSDGSIPASELVEERSNQPWTRDEWKFANIKVSDEYLIVKGEVVMDRSEEPYMQKLAEIASHAGGRVMETGFGMGISAKFIHTFDTNVTEHVIIEGNAAVFHQNVLKFAANYSAARPIFGFFEDVMPLLRSNSFDGVLYDTFPMDADDFATPQCVHQRKIMKEVHRILKPGGVFTYFANWESLRGDKRALKRAGFKDDGIHIERYKMETILGDCKTYPNCKEVKADFQVPRIVKT